MSASDPILIVGAGLAGLVAGLELRAHGYKVILLESGAAAGGRLASEDVGDGHFDSGAQFFTIRFPRFHKMVTAWKTAGVVVEWSRGFAGSSGQARRDGHPRYRGKPDMAAIARHLARDLDVRLETFVEAVNFDHGRWLLSLAGGGEIDSRALILTPPLPLTLSLLDAGSVTLPPEIRDPLEAIVYQPCLALLAVLDGPSGLPAPGAMQLLSEPLAFIADNEQKGVSPAVPAVTIHAGPRFSQEQWGTADDAVASQMLEAASPWLKVPVAAWRLHRWRYSMPAQTFPARTLASPAFPGLHFAGDVFAGPRIEGAALSGLAAAEAILEE